MLAGGTMGIIDPVCTTYARYGSTPETTTATGVRIRVRAKNAVSTRFTVFVTVTSLVE